MRKNASVAILLGVLSVAAPKIAESAVVDNPGDKRLTAYAGFIRINDNVFNLSSPWTLTGAIDEFGGVAIGTVDIPEAAIDVPLLGTVIVRITALPPPPTGQLIPALGTGNATVGFRIAFVHPLFGDNCAIRSCRETPTQCLNDITLATASYDQVTGQAQYSTMGDAIPEATQCGFFGGALNAYLGLPSTNSEVQLSIQWDDGVSDPAAGWPTGADIP